MDPSRVTRRSFIAAGAGAGMAGLAGCGLFQTENPFTDGPGEDRTIEMGVLIPQSGELGEFATELEDGIRLVEHQLEAVTEPDWNLDLTLRDTESDPDTAVSAGEELVDEGLQAIVGPGSSESAAALVDEVLIPDGIAACSPLASAGLTDIPHGGVFFSMAPRSRLIGRAVGLPVSFNRLGSVAILHATTEYGTRLNDLIADELDVRGTDVTAQVAVEPDDPIDSRLDEAFADDPEGIVLACNPGEGIPLLENMKRDYDPEQTIVTDRLRINDLPTRIDSDLADAIAVSIRPEWYARDERFADQGDEDGEVPEEEEVEVDEGAERLTRFAEAFERTYDRFPSIHAAKAFDSTVALLLGTIAAGEDNYDGEEIGDWLPDMVNWRDQVGGAAVQTFGHSDYWEGLSMIRDGVHNSYAGGSGGITFNNGIRQSPQLQAATYAPDTRFKFEETRPIYP